MTHLTHGWASLHMTSFQPIYNKGLVGFYKTDQKAINAKKDSCDKSQQNCDRDTLTSTMTLYKGLPELRLHTPQAMNH